MENKFPGYWYKSDNVFRIYINIYDTFHLDYDTRNCELQYRIHYQDYLYSLLRSKIEESQREVYNFYKK
jgi:hypothetical protein